MNYEQRDVPPEATFAPSDELWTPEPVSASDVAAHRVVPEATDHYVVVDEIVEGGVRLVGSPWPKIDATERLAFDDDGRVIDGAFVLEALQARIDGLRAERNQAPRALRVGDTFLVRGDVDDMEAWTVVYDVTGPAREEAKQALFRAAIPARADTVAKAPPSIGADAPAGESFAPELAASTRETLASRRERRSRRRGQVANPVI